MSFNVVFMGTPEFARVFLEHLYVKKNFNIKGVFTQPPKKSHRGQKINPSPVYRFAKEKNLEVFCPTSFSSSVIDTIKKINPEVIVVVAYGLILPPEVLRMPSCGSVNVHASMLPKWRGAAPIQRSIMNGDNKTGISIMKMEEGLDEGPTYLQSEIKIEENDTYEDVCKNLLDVGKISLDIFFSEHKPYLPLPQDPNKVTYAKKIEKSEMQINFDETAFVAHKKVCAFSPKPGAWFLFNQHRIKILSCIIKSQKGEPSTILSQNFLIACSDISIQPLIVQREGKKIMTIENFIRGFYFNPGDLIRYNDEI